MTNDRKNSDEIFKILNTDLLGLNLTAITDQDEFYIKQYVDSIFPFVELEELKKIIENSDCILDVGFGGGFPLIPLAQAFPHKKFFGIDSKNKKVEAVKLIIEKLNIKNIHVKHLRLEELEIDMKAMVTFKAVGKILEYLKIINSKGPITVGFLKGKNLRDLEVVPKAVNDLILFREFDYCIDGNIDRKIILYKRDVPRGTNSRNNLVKLSSFD